MICKNYKEKRPVQGDLPSTLICHMLSRFCCYRLPRTNPNISTSQCDIEVMVHEELSDDKRMARMKKVEKLVW